MNQFSLLKVLCLLSISACSLASIAQSISFTLTTPTNPIQDADVGSMTFGDVDMDGDQDLLITGSGSGIKTTLYLNDGNGNFSEDTSAPFTRAFGGKVDFQDLDGDNDLDVLLTGNSSGLKISELYTNDGTGSFTLVTNSPIKATEGGDYEFGDLDSDGDLDLVLTGYDAANNGFGELYLNDGSANFSISSHQPFPALKNGEVGLYDLDGDLDLDVVLTGEDLNANVYTRVYTNDGSAQFTESQDTAILAVQSGALAGADVDQDGDVDLLVCGLTNLGSPVSNLYLNDGSANFSLSTSASFAPTFVGESTFKDFDGDGDLDLLHIGSGAGGLATNSIVAIVYESQGNGQFTISDSLIGTYLSSAAVGDIDGDQDLDIVIGGTSTGMPVRGTRIYTNETPSLSLVEARKETQVSIWPNPAGDFVYMGLKDDGILDVNISDLSGKSFCRLPMNGNERLDVSHLCKGVYVLSVRGSQGLKRSLFSKL